jgi:rSAM/selenodomain-associated transferase 1
LSGALLVFTKEPRAGLVKTRMCPPWTFDQAGAFHASLLADVLEASARAATRLGLAPYLCVAPPEAVPRVARGAPVPFRTLPQRGRDLAERMAHAAADVHARGHAPLLLRGSDSPTLPESALRSGLDALARGADVALAPDQAGGYVLVALRRPAPGLFDHPMSTSSVLEDTLACARRLGLRSELLEAGFDVDTAADLAHLSEARDADPALPCPRTLAFLDSQKLWGS